MGNSLGFKSLSKQLAWESKISLRFVDHLHPAKLALAKRELQALAATQGYRY